MQSFEELSRGFLRALAESERAGRIPVSGGTIIISSRGSEPPGHILWMGCVHAGVRAFLSSPAEANIHLIPYSEEIDARMAVVFSASINDPRALESVVTASALGLESYFVGPRMNRAYEERLSSLGAHRITVDGAAPLLSMSFIALNSIPRLRGAREERFRAEVGDLPSAPGWIVERYGGALDSARRARGHVLYTPSTKPGAYYHCLMTGCLEPLPLEALHRLGSLGGGAVAYVNSTEEHLYKDVLLEIRRRGLEVEVFRLNTDPLTAGIYSMILAGFIAGRLV